MSEDMHPLFTDEQFQEILSGRKSRGRSFATKGIPDAVRIYCRDGFNVSVAAGWHACCSPRDNFGPYAAVELGYPSVSMPEMAEWVEGDDPERADTVWGWVPVEVVVALVNRHGGLKEVR